METFGKADAVFRSGAVFHKKATLAVLLRYKGLTVKKKLLKNEILSIEK